MALKTVPFDPVEFLKTPEDTAAWLRTQLEMDQTAAETRHGIELAIAALDRMGRGL